MFPREEKVGFSLFFIARTQTQGTQKKKQKEFCALRPAIVLAISSLIHSEWC